MKKISRSNKYIILITSCLMFLLAGIAVTVAVLTDQRITINTLQFGEVKISVIEEHFPNQQVLPGQQILHKQVIRNEAVDCYVRAIVTIDDTGNEQSLLEFFECGALGENWYIANNEQNNDRNSNDEITIYYDKWLAKDEITSELFDSFMLLPMNQKQQALLSGINHQFKVVIVIEAVQASIGNVYFSSPEQAFNEAGVFLNK